ncbi:histone-lysine N-methyltransferase SETMAR [Trichonephila clavipes]|nr:histone-lysine N-methyltransferase SETMAR [Trichonephila clavipes]
MLRRLVGATAPGHHDCSIQELKTTIADLYSNCHENQCDEFSPIGHVDDIKMFPNKEQVAKLCPIVLRYITCMLDTVKECTGMGIEELKSNDSVSEHEIFLLSVGNLFADLCDEDSSFHKAVFKRGRKSLEDNERLERPNTATTDEKITKGHQMLLDDHRIKVREIAEAMNMSKERVCYILNHHLDMRKLSTRLLTFDQKCVRM